LNCQTTIGIETKAVFEQPVRELWDGLRRSFQERMIAGEYLGGLRAFQEGESLPRLSGVGMETSNVGAVKVKPPIEDVWFAVFWTGMGFPGYAANIAYTVKNRLRGTMMMNDADMGEEEAQRFCRTVWAAVNGINPERSIEEAIDWLKEIK
jgi:hypothetical protein